MPCKTAPPTKLGADFSAPRTVTIELEVKAVGAAPLPPVLVDFASYAGGDVTANPFRITVRPDFHGLIIVPSCPVDGQFLGLFEKCSATESRLLRRFKFKAADPRKIFVVEG